MRLLYCIGFLNALIPAYVIERLYWEARGMTVLEVVWTEMLFGAVVLVCEVPAGWFADRVGRKPAIVLGILFEAGMFAILIGAHSFGEFAIAITLSAIGAALLSGSENALLYDVLKSLEKEDRFDWHLGRLRSIQIVGLMLAAFAGSWLAITVSFELNYWLSLSSTCLAFLLSLFLQEAPNHATAEYFSWRTTLQKGYSFFKRTPSLWSLFIWGSLLLLSASFVEEFWQLYLRDMGVDVAYFGLFYGFVLFVQIPGNLLAHSLRKRWRRHLLMRLFMGGAAAALLGCAFLTGLWGVCMLLLVLFMAGIMEPIWLGALHEVAEDAIRATLESIQSFVFHLLLIGVGMCFGIAANHVSLAFAFGILGCLCGIAVWVKVKK